MKKKILVVDDEDFQRDLLNKLLTKSGYTVSEAESPEVALALMKEEDFPVIITDLIMLDMDGVEFCQRIRERNSQSAIIALTGYADLYDLEKLKRVGFDNYLTKPIKLDKIQPVVEAGFKKSSLNKETRKQLIMVCSTDHYSRDRNIFKKLRSGAVELKDILADEIPSVVNLETEILPELESIKKDTIGTIRCYLPNGEYYFSGNWLGEVRQENNTFIFNDRYSEKEVKVSGPCVVKEE